MLIYFNKLITLIVLLTNNPPLLNLTVKNLNYTDYSCNKKGFSVILVNIKK